LIRPPI